MIIDKEHMIFGGAFLDLLFVILFVGVSVSYLLLISYWQGSILIALGLYCGLLSCMHIITGVEKPVIQYI